MKDIKSCIDVYQNDYDVVIFHAESLIDKLQKNKLRKEDRELLSDALGLLLEIHRNNF